MLESLIEAKWSVESTYQNIDKETVLEKFKEIAQSNVTKEKDGQLATLKEENS